jgi:hypothetical protein
VPSLADLDIEELGGLAGKAMDVALTLDSSRDDRLPAVCEHGDVTGCLPALGFRHRRQLSANSAVPKSSVDARSQVAGQRL